VTDDCGVVTETIDMTVSIPILAPLEVTAIPDTVVLCPESPVQLSAVVSGGQPGYTYQWSGGLGTASTANVAPPNDQSWWLTVTDLCGHDTTDMVTVIVDYDTVEVVITPDTTICHGDGATLTANPSLGWGGYNFSWSTGSIAPSIDVQPPATMTYTVTVTDGCGISSSDNSQLGVNIPVADFSWNGSVYVQNYPIQFIDESVGAITWSWDFDYPGITSEEQYPVIVWPDSGLFTVMLAISDPLGCVDTAYHTLWIDPEMQFYAPSSFTPDGNGVNETFYGIGVGIDQYDMRIFDRWGELIFETTELFGAWDGTVNGTPVPNGTYVYYFRVHAISGKREEKLGHVVLVR
jgi:gliding motility-associated-like protein